MTESPKGIYIYVDPPGNPGKPFSVFVPEGTNPKEAEEKFLDILPVELGGRWTPVPHIEDSA